MKDPHTTALETLVQAIHTVACTQQGDYARRFSDVHLELLGSQYKGILESLNDADQRALVEYIAMRMSRLRAYIAADLRQHIESIWTPPQTVEPARLRTRPSLRLVVDNEVKTGGAATPPGHSNRPR